MTRTISRLAIAAPKDMTISDMLCVMFVVLLPFQDLSFQLSPLSIFAANASVVPIALHMLWKFVNATSRGQLRANKWLLLVVLYVIALNLVNLAYWGPTSEGQSNIAKFITMSILYIFFLYPIFAMDFQRIAMRGPLLAAAGIVLFGILGGDILHISMIAGGIFHPDVSHDIERLISFSPEASVAGNLIGTLALLLMNYIERPLPRWGVLMIALGLLATLGSKGSVFVIIATFALAQFLIFRKVRVTTRIAILGAGGIFAAVALARTLASLTESLTSSTTVATRGIAALAALLLLQDFPLGVGFIGYIPGYRVYVVQAMTLGSSVLQQVTGSDLNFIELLRYVNQDSASALIFHPGILDFAAVFGVPGLAAFGWFVYGAMRGIKRFSSDHTFLLLAFLFTVISVCTYMYHLRFYHLSLVFALVWQQWRANRRVDASNWNGGIGLAIRHHATRQA